MRESYDHQPLDGREIDKDPLTLKVVFQDHQLQDKQP